MLLSAPVTRSREGKGAGKTPTRFTDILNHFCPSGAEIGILSFAESIAKMAYWRG